MRTSNIKAKIHRPDFRAAVRRWRQQLGLTQPEAAKRLGVPFRTFQAWELGARTPRGIAKRLIIATLSKP